MKTKLTEQEIMVKRDVLAGRKFCDLQAGLDCLMTWEELLATVRECREVTADVIDDAAAAEVDSRGRTVCTWSIRELAKSAGVELEIVE